MRVVINQSNYLPWKGYFDLIHDADLFIFLDDVQFTKNDWRNRNRIKASRGCEWITIPVGQNIRRLVCEVEMPGSDWARQHWGIIERSYRQAPYFEKYAPFFMEVFLRMRWKYLSELNQYLVKAIGKNFFDLKTKFLDSRDFQIQTRGQDRVINLLKQVGARTYISGPAGKTYLEPERFATEGLSLQWKDYSGYPEYSQMYPPFEHAVSILDLLFSMGPKAADYIWGWRNTLSSSA